MTGRIPHDAFSFYVSLGPERSYQAVADKYEVSKTAVTRYAVQHKWAERLDAIEKKARENSDQRLQETIEQLNERHLKVLKIIEHKALEALRTLPMDSAMDAVRALEITMRQTRLIRGEPTEHSAVEIVDLLQRQHSSWLLHPGTHEDWGDPVAPTNPSDAVPGEDDTASDDGTSEPLEDADDEP